jgi:hypothetical protein
MKVRLALALMVLGLVVGCQKQPMNVAPSSPDVSPIVDAEIGKPLPSKYEGHGNNMGAFEFVSVPVMNSSVSADMQQVNLFTETESGLVSGYRGDRAMENEAACSAAAERIEQVLRAQFPTTTAKSDPERRYASQDGQIEAGVTCQPREPVVTLTLVVSSPIIEDRMMEKSRNERR